MAEETRHLPYPAPIDAYGKGGFRFANMSHRGSLLCLPDGIWPWPPRQASEITEEALVASGLVRRRRDGIRVLAKGELTAALKLTVTGASKSAVEAVEKAGGTLTVTAPRAEAAAE